MQQGTTGALAAALGIHVGLRRHNNRKGTLQMSGPRLQCLPAAQQQSPTELRYKPRPNTAATLFAAVEKTSTFSVSIIYIVIAAVTVLLKIRMQSSLCRDCIGLYSYFRPNVRPPHAHSKVCRACHTFHRQHCLSGAPIWITQGKKACRIRAKQLHS